ncbi:MAG TPA: sugar phosphate isomerase/epimerase family protein [Sphingobacteriaceae bacterium]|nr:sugar phosphate isomerase/epimerase family protein [Sphingobacteriaceae bacterium]
MALNVKLGVSTWLWTSPFKTEDASALFAKIKSFGYDKVEIAVEDPQLIDTSEIRKRLAENELDVIICGAFGDTRDLTSDDESLRKNGLNYIEECLNIAAELDSGFFAGPMYSAVGKARMVSPEQRKVEWDRAVEGVRKASEMAASKGLDIGIESLNRFESDLINNTDDVLKLINDVNHSAAKICLDMFHMNIEEPNPEQAIIAAGDKLIHIQVSENYRGTPGTGATNWQAYYNGLEKINYSGTVSIESFTPENKELAAAVCIWRDLAKDQDSFGREGNIFLKKWISGV